MSYSYTVTKSTLAIVVEGEAKLFDREDEKFLPLRDACLAEDWGKIDELLDTEFKKAIEYHGFRVTDDLVFVDDECLPSYLGKRLKDLPDAGKPYDIVLKFWHKLKENPSYHSVNQLFSFLENNHMRFTNDGNFIGYKAINGDWTDCHTGKVDNSIGANPKMSRRNVNDDWSLDCSSGFHIGSYEFAVGFRPGGGRLVECEIDPRDVVSVAPENGFHKLRVCEYKVVAEIDATNPEPTNQVYGEDDDTDYEECGCDLGECDCDDDEADYNDYSYDSDDDDDDSY